MATEQKVGKQGSDHRATGSSSAFVTKTLDERANAKEPHNEDVDPVTGAPVPRNTVNPEEDPDKDENLQPPVPP